MQEEMSAQFFPEVTKAWQEAAVDGVESPPTACKTTQYEGTNCSFVGAGIRSGSGVFYGVERGGRKRSRL